MKRFMVVWGVVWAVFSSVVLAAEPNLVVVKTMGAVSPELKARLVSWVSTTIDPATDGGIAVSRTLKGQGQVILVLAGECKPGDLPVSGTNGVVVVDLKALKLTGMTTPAAQETYARRVEKLAVAGVAMQLGMAPCPFPRCALYQHETVQELDEKARGLCPPCTGKLEEALERYRKR
jgi:hypothetical protein